MANHRNDAKVFAALGDEIRLTIVDALRGGEKTASQLLGLVEVGQSTLSHHMKLLTDAGIVSPRRNGRWTYYALDAGGIGGAAAMLSGLTATAAGDADGQNPRPQRATKTPAPAKPAPAKLEQTKPAQAAPKKDVDEELPAWMKKKQKTDGFEPWL